MPSTTGIELSPDSCVLVRARSARGAVEVSALHAIGRIEWPTQDRAIADLLRGVRRRKRLPRRARVVVWGLPDDLAPNNPIVKASVQPVVAAGFRVHAVMSPPQALAALARTRPRTAGNAAVWLALNVQGAAIAIVRDGELLYSRMFDWAYRPDVVGTKAELLQRYSLVAHLAPEVRRGISVVRASHGVTANTAVTCGDLPELRSLTMPLIEELDLEVETLDSTEGLVSISDARVDRFVESAPALRLACAAAIAHLPRKPLWTSRRWRIAAAVALVAGGAWAAQRYWQDLPSSTAPARDQVRTAQAQISKPSSTSSSAATPQLTQPSVPPPATLPSTAPPVVAEPPAHRATAPAPAPTQPKRNVPAPERMASPTVPAPEAKMPPAVSSDAASRPASPRSSSAATSPIPALPPPQPTSFAIPVQRVEQEEKPEPLKAPIPVIDSILIAHDRRLAVIGGVIVGIGDSVGARVVVAIERDWVLFREPSGFELRVSLRTGPGRP